MDGYEGKKIYVPKLGLSLLAVVAVVRLAEVWVATECHRSVAWIGRGMICWRVVSYRFTPQCWFGPLGALLGGDPFPKTKALDSVPGFLVFIWGMIVLMEEQYSATQGRGGSFGQHRM